MYLKHIIVTPPLGVVSALNKKEMVDLLSSVIVFH